MTNRPDLRLLTQVERAARSLAGYLEPRMGEHGLSPAEARLLSHLATSGPTSPGELRRIFGHRPSTLTGLLDRLEEKELIRRQLHPGDRRSFLIEVTMAGTARARQVGWDLVKLEERIAAAVGDDDLGAFERVVAAIDEMVSAGNGLRGAKNLPG